MAKNILPTLEIDYEGFNSNFPLGLIGLCLSINK